MVQMNIDNVDYADAYRHQVRKFRPYAMMLGAFILATLSYSLTVIYLWINGRVSHDEVADLSRIGTIIFAAVICLFIYPIYRARKCPNCNRFMGRNITNNCPLCGVKLV